MKRSIPENFRDFMKKMLLNSSRTLNKRFAKNEKIEASNLLASLVSIRCEGKRNMREYIIEMSNIAFKLKALKLELSDNLLVHPIIYLSSYTIQSIYSELQ